MTYTSKTNGIRYDSKINLLFINTIISLYSFFIIHFQIKLTQIKEGNSCKMKIWWQGQLVGEINEDCPLPNGKSNIPMYMFNKRYQTPQLGDAVGGTIRNFSYEKK